MKLKLFFLSIAALTFGSAQAQETYSGLPTSDGYVRSDQPTSSYGNNSNTIQLQNQTGDGSITTYGVMSFDFTAPNADYEVKRAVLRLTTRGVGGNRVAKVYALPNYIDAEKATWNDLNDDFSKSLLTTPIATFSVVGTVGKNPESTDPAGDLSSWYNTIDITEYVKKLSGHQFSILLVKDVADEKDGKGNAYNFKFYSKETTSKTWGDKTAIVDADIRPQLTVEYQPFSLSQTDYVGLPSGDGWIRSDKPDQATGSTDNMQMIVFSGNESKAAITSYAIMSFEFTAPEEGSVVNNAVLRTMTRVFNGGDRILKVYALSEYVNAETATWNSLGDKLTTALASTPIASLEIKGESGKNITQELQYNSNKVLSAWQNTIDLSDYVKTLNTNKFSILIAKVSDENRNSQFYTKEALALNWHSSINDGAAISVDDIRPQFTVTYKPDTYKLTVTDAGAATLVLPFDATIPSDVKAYTLTYAGDDKVAATEVTSGTIAANTPVLVNAEAGDYDFEATSSWVSGSVRTTTDALTGVFRETIVPIDSYILTKKDDKVGFRKVDGLTNTVAANRAYLTAPGGGARLSILFDDETTGVQTVKVQQEDNVIYNLQGVRVENPTKGIYVKNGRKFVVK